VILRRFGCHQHDYRRFTVCFGCHQQMHSVSAWLLSDH
jgi:predicted Fe-S protein YdhL (DUF1289 family)